jgi:hypothetical protein
MSCHCALIGAFQERKYTLNTKLNIIHNHTFKNTISTPLKRLKSIQLRRYKFLRYPRTLTSLFLTSYETNLCHQTQPIFYPSQTLNFNEHPMSYTHLFCLWKLFWYTGKTLRLSYFHHILLFRPQHNFWIKFCTLNYTQCLPQTSPTITAINWTGLTSPLLSLCH